jgi:hypothetical protein
LEAKRPGRGAAYSLSFNSEIKYAWSYTSIPPYIFKAWCLVKHTDACDSPFYGNVCCKKGTESGQLLRDPNVRSKYNLEFFIGEETLENRTVSGHEMKFSSEKKQ